MQARIKNFLMRFALPGFGTLITLLIVIPAALSLHESFDLLFNIATGRDILANGFPTIDPFSLTATSPWFPHEWGYSVLAALSVDILGGQGPAVLVSAVLSIQLLLLWKLLSKAGNYSASTILFFALAVWGQDFTWNTERAYHLGHLMFAIALYLVYLDHLGKSYAKWLFIPLLISWANLHGSWIVGPALMASYSVGAIIDKRKVDGERIIKLLIALLAYFSAALSPEGFRTCLYPLRFLGGLYNQQIAEWHPMDLANGCSKAVALLMLLVTITMIRSRGKNLAMALPVFGLVLVTIFVERFSPFSSMAMAFYLASNYRRKPFGSSRENQPSRVLYRSVKKLLLTARTWNYKSGGGSLVAISLLAISIGIAAAPQKLIDRLDPKLFPVKALKELRQHPPGKVFNTFRLGGAISAIDGPGYKVFIDGRSDLFPQRIHDDYRTVSLVLPGWKKILDEYDPDYLLWSTISYGLDLLEALKSSKEWIVLVDEPVGVLWQKKKK